MKTNLYRTIHLLTRHALALMLCLNVLLNTISGQEWELDFDWHGANTESIVSTETAVFAGTFNGVYKHSIGGSEWEHLTPSLNMGVVRHLVVLDNVILAAGQSGLWRSSDQGITWSQPPTVGNLHIRGLDVGSSGQIYCTTLDNSFGGAGIRLYSSMNTGFSWSLISTIPNSNAASTAHLCVGFNDVIFVAPGNVGSGPHGLYQSSNSGQSWGGIVLDFAVSRIVRLNAGYVACSGAINNSNYVYSSNGSNWQTGNSSGLGSVRITGAAQLGGQVYFSTTGGTFEVNSSMLGISPWSFIGPQGVSFSCITAFDNQLYLGHWGVHTVLLYPQGTWAIYDAGTEGNLAGALGRLGNEVFLYVNSKAFYLKSGSGWSAVNSGLPPSNSLGLYSLTNLRESSTASRVIAFANGEFESAYFVLHQGQNQWQPLTTTLPAGLQHTFITYDEPSGFYYLGSSNMGLWRSSDLVSWAEFNSGLNQFHVVDFARLSSNETVAVTTAGVYLRSDNGNQWTTVVTSSSNVQLRRLRVDNESKYYVSTSAGVYTVVNGQATLANGANGLGTFLNHEEVFDASNDYACVNNMGLMRKSAFLPWEMVEDIPITQVRRTYFHANTGVQYVAGRSLYLKSIPNSVNSMNPKDSGMCLSLQHGELLVCSSPDVRVYSLSLYDSLGRLLFTENVSSGSSIRIPETRSGLVIAVLRDKNGNIRGRLKYLQN